MAAGGAAVAARAATEATAAYNARPIPRPGGSGGGRARARSTRRVPQGRRHAAQGPSRSAWR